jgi:HlyD family secretion protein
MKLGKILTIAILILVLAAALGCGSQNTANQQQSTVTRGDLSVKVNGSGKSGYAVDANLVFSSAGKIEIVSVKKGDIVAKGTMLAKLETDTLELALSQAQVAQAQAQVALTQVQSAQTQADIALSSAQFNLDRTTAVNDIQDKINSTSIKKEQTQILLQSATRFGDSIEVAYWLQRIANFDNDTRRYQNDLATLLSKDPFIGDYLYLAGQEYNRLAIEDARIKQLGVTSAQQAVQQAAQNIEQAKRSLDQANKAVAMAQKQLTDASITAPFDGLIAALDIKDNDIITTPGASLGVPIKMVDPKSLEINIEVDEIDVAQTKVNQKAIINMDAFPDTKFDGKITAISTLPVAKPQNSGVVVYEVKVIFEGPVPSSVKSGMSATVDIVTTEKKNVLLAPSKSIKKDSKGQTFVNLMVNQKIEERSVVTGLTDGTQTEIISGLNEGDVVVRTP